MNRKAYYREAVRDTRRQCRRPRWAANLRAFIDEGGVDFDAFATAIVESHRRMYSVWWDMVLQATVLPSHLLLPTPIVREWRIVKVTYENPLFSVETPRFSRQSGPFLS